MAEQVAVVSDYQKISRNFAVIVLLWHTFLHIGCTKELVDSLFSLRAWKALTYTGLTMDKLWSFTYNDPKQRKVQEFVSVCSVGDSARVIILVSLTSFKLTLTDRLQCPHGSKWGLRTERLTWIYMGKIKIEGVSNKPPGEIPVPR